MYPFSQIIRSIRKQVFLFLILLPALVGLLFGYLGSYFYSTTTPPPSSEVFSQKEDEKESSSRTVEIVKKYSPAVVSIIATQDLPVFERRPYSPFEQFCDDPFFRRFFESCELQKPELEQRGTERREVSAGTGFIVKHDGIIITNRHVVTVEGAEYTVVLNNEKQYEAKVLARDPIHDIAILKIEGIGFPTVKLGNSDQIDVGETVVAIGNALGRFSNTVSKGIVSGLARSITAVSGSSSERLDQVIQTDTAINPGNSGGPLINLEGEVIGMNTAIVSGAQNVGFAIPINEVKKDIQDIETKGRISYPFLGVNYIIINPEIAQRNKLSVDYGAYVSKTLDGKSAVVAGSPAEKADIKENDIILEVDSRKINDEYTLSEAIQRREVGDSISLKILRQGKAITIRVILGERT